MGTVLITGANRGIGLELTRQYLDAGWHVIATCRNPAAALDLKQLAGRAPAQVSIEPLDVRDENEVSSLARKLSGTSVDLLINNAGVRRMDAFTFGEIDTGAFRETMDINVLGPLKVAESFVPHLETGGDPLLVMMSSNLGSIEKNREGGDYGYRASKAALNAVMRSLAVDLADRGIAVIALHPGWVKTDMGGRKAPLSVEESVRGIRAVLGGLSLRDTGRFLRWDGHEEPW